MKVMRIYKCCETKDLYLEEIEKPRAKENWVVVKVMAFGLNHSESLFR